MFFFRSVLECPALIHKITIDDGDGEGKTVEKEQFYARGYTGDIDQRIQDEKINAGIDTADDDELGELFDQFRKRTAMNDHLRKRNPFRCFDIHYVA